ncbi:hypothetical protein ABPG75_005433 [Micractinium tetrahymenae]
MVRESKPRDAALGLLLALGLVCRAVSAASTRQLAPGGTGQAGPRSRHTGGTAARLWGQRRRLLDSASLQVTNGNCTKDFQLGVSYPVASGFDPSTCAGTFTTDVFTYCTSQPQNVAGGSANAQTTLSLPDSLSPVIVATYVTAYASPDSIFPATYDPSLSSWSTPDGYVCSPGDDGCYFFFYITQQPVVMQCAAGGPPAPSSGGSSSIGAIVGGVVGGIVAVAAGVALFFFVRRRRQRRAAAPQAAASEPDYRIDKIETTDRELGLGKPGAPPGLAPGSAAYSPLGGALGAGAAVGAAALVGSAASGSESASRDADAASGPSSGTTAARIRQLAQDDPILSYIHSKMPGLTATAGSQGSGLGPSTAGGSGEVGVVRRTSTMAVDARSWEVMFDEIEIIRPIGEGSFGRVEMPCCNEPGQLVSRTRAGDEVQKGWGKANAPHLCFCNCPLQVKLNEEASLLAAMRVLLARQPDRYLHSRPNPIVHRDLKSPNLVTDFNLSRLLEDSLDSRSSSMAAMNPRWLAPEVMKGGHATKASDVYSFAIVMWRLLSWEIPWSQTSAWQLVQQLMGGARLEVPSLEAMPGPDKPDPASYNTYVTLMQACWSAEEFARPTFDDISTVLRNLFEATPAS